jgi:hypothetical protein
LCRFSRLRRLRSLGWCDRRYGRDRCHGCHRSSRCLRVHGCDGRSRCSGCSLRGLVIAVGARETLNRSAASFNALSPCACMRRSSSRVPAQPA